MAFGPDGVTEMGLLEFYVSRWRVGEAGHESTSKKKRRSREDCSFEYTRTILYPFVLVSEHFHKFHCQFAALSIVHIIS